MSLYKTIKSKRKPVDTRYRSGVFIYTFRDRVILYDFELRKDDIHSPASF